MGLRVLSRRCALVLVVAGLLVGGSWGFASKLSSVFVAVEWGVQSVDTYLVLVAALVAALLLVWAGRYGLRYRRAAQAKAGLEQLAVTVLDRLWLLSNNFAHPLREAAWMTTYRRENKADDLHDLAQRVAQLSSSTRPDHEMQALRTLANALHYAISISHKMRDWSSQGHSHPQAVQVLYGHRQALTRLVEALQGSAASVQQLDHVELGTRLESQTLRRGPELYGETTVYTCCCYKPWHDPQLDMPHLVVIHLESQYSNALVTMVLLHKEHKWRDQLELQQLIEQQVEARAAHLDFVALAEGNAAYGLDQPA